MHLLMDNMVAGGVSRLFARRGHRVMPVRRALGQEASDAAIAAYAHAQRVVVVTHDGGMAARCKRLGVQHLWLRVSEAHAEARLADVVEQVETLLDGAALRVVVGRQPVRAEGDWH